MPHAIAKQKPRLGSTYQPLTTPERWVYGQKARGHKPERNAWKLSVEEVQRLRALYFSGAAPLTLAAEFSIPRREVKKIGEAPFRLRADVRRPFETSYQMDTRLRWLAEEITNAHLEALHIQLALDWTEAKKENREREKAARKAVNAGAA